MKDPNKIMGINVIQQYSECLGQEKQLCSQSQSLPHNFGQTKLKRLTAATSMQDPGIKQSKGKYLLNVAPVLQKTHNASPFKGVATLLDADRICHCLLCYRIKS
jgi:hypothetical protein